MAEVDLLDCAPGMDPQVSIVVPLHRPTPAFWRCLDEVLGLGGDRHELIVVSDREVECIPSSVQLLLTGSGTDTSPAEKRDCALPRVRGRICAFIDDDAYPAKDWLDRALVRLEDPTITAVGGPGLTPPGSSWSERASGAFYESRFGSGPLRYRFRQVGRTRDVDDYPGFNLFIRTSALREIGGWASRFYGGEDTKVCLNLVEAGYRIVYDPDVVVYHYRRPIFRAHMRQLANVGRHRGYFVRAFPRTSARSLYFAPSLGLISVLAGIALSGGRRRGEFLPMLLALSAVLSVLSSRETKDPSLALVLPAVIAASHLAYGVGFLRGLVTSSIDSM